MLNHIKSNSTIVGITMFGCLVLALGVLLLQVTVAQASEYEGNVRLLIGQKQLESDDWLSMDSQNAFGVLLDIKKKEWPVSIVLDLMVSGADSDSDDTQIERGYTAEQHLGIRKTWTMPNSVFHPYIGGGLAIITAGFERRDAVGGADDDDTGLGPWLGGGAYWKLTPNINLGLDVRYSDADVTVFEQEIKAGGLHAGLTLGYNW